jgi:L-amino acid N-acyltransferase YncA
VTGVATRPAQPRDAAAMAAIHREGIEDRVATFATVPLTEAEMSALAASEAPVLVAERDGEVVAWAKIGAYSDPHPYYAGVGEATLYVARGARGAGVGRELMLALEPAAQASGHHKLVGKVFTTNAASIALVRACGWREVGVHRRHGRLDGEWKDVLVVEKLLAG